MIELRHVDRSLAYFSQRNNYRACNCKMIAPSVASRIVKTSKLPGWKNNATDICAFINIAQRAGISEVLEVAGSAVFKTYDMI